MKAEPESRLEKGHDIKFSIDDLAAKSEPEPWDGESIFPYNVQSAAYWPFILGIRAYPGESST